MSETSDNVPPDGQVEDLTLYDKVYLGDAVYCNIVEGTGGMLALSAEGVFHNNEIFLEPVVVDAFLQFLIAKRYISGYSRE